MFFKEKDYSLSLSVFLCLSVSLPSLSVSVCLSLFHCHTSVCVSDVSLSPFVSGSALFACLFLYPSVFVCMFVSFCMSLHSSLSLSACLSLFVSVSLFVCLTPPNPSHCFCQNSPCPTKLNFAQLQRLSWLSCCVWPRQVSTNCSV